MTTTVATGAGTGTRQRAGNEPLLWTLLIAMFMAVLDTAIVNNALPTIHTELHASGAGLQLSVSGYTLAYAMLIVSGARLGDLWGHGRMFRAGLALFTLASLACGLAPSTGALIGFRAVQGVGAAAMVPQVLSIVQRNFDGPERIRATSLYTAVIAGGAVAGQILGGVLISANLFGTTWRPSFLVNVPIGIAAFVISGRVLPKDKGDPGRDLDPLGVAVLTPTVLAFVLPLILGHDEGWPLWGWLLLAASAVGVVVFVRVEARVARRGGTPVIPGRLMRLPGFAVSNATLLAVMSVLLGTMFAMTIHLQSALGFSPLDSGLAFAPGALFMFVISTRWRRLPVSWYHRLIPVGFLLAGASQLANAFVMGGGGTGGLARWILFSTNGCGIALAYSPLLGLTISRVPLRDAADASGVISTVTQLGQVIGIATFGTLFLNLSAHVSPGGPVHASAHAITVTYLVGAAVCALGAALGARVPRVVSG